MRVSRTRFSPQLSESAVAAPPGEAYVRPIRRGVVLNPECTECKAVWATGDDERWRAYLTDDEPAELAFYCAECAEGEFGSD